MKISRSMNLSDLQERMGPTTTEAEADKMRDLLVDGYDGMDTRDIPEYLWIDMLDQAQIEAR